MKRQIIVTGDGSTTIQIPEWDEQYHSKHGAIQEAYHVFIKNGFHHITKTHKKVDILEIGLGTGLNCLITFLEVQRVGIEVDYVGVEAFPVRVEEIEQLNYLEELKVEQHRHVFDKMHQLSWEETHDLDDHFRLTKRKQFFQDIEDSGMYDLVYFDAFGARVQPELWAEDIFQKMFMALKPKGILVTYSAKGSVRRAMQQVGFEVERLEGPPGKREMLRATKGI